MSSISCEACGIILQGGEEEWRRHKKTKSHKGRAADLASCQRKLFVGDLPVWLSQQQLTAHFSQFGLILDVFFHGKFAMIEFSSTDVVDRILEREPHIVCGKRLRVDRKRFTARPLPSPAAKTPSLVPEVMDMLRNTPGVEEQMTALEVACRLTEDGKRQRLEAQRYLQCVLQQYVPEVRLVAYGSTVSGLGMRHSDVDLMLQYDQSWNRNNLTPAPRLPHLSKIKHKLSVAQGRVTLSSLTQCEPSEQVLFFTSVLRGSEAAQVFNRFQPIPKARVPLIQTYHKAGHFEMDLTFGANSLAVANTRLIRLLLSLDERVSPLMFAVKVWAKRTGVSDHGSTPVSLTSYALFLLVYTYLQNMTPPVLPSVESLAALCGPDSREFCMGIDCSFCKSLPLIREQLLTSKNSQSLPSLLQGFFTFYSERNLLSSVLCVRQGTLVDLLKFRSLLNCSPHLCDFKVKDICIQDPFELSHNTAGNVNFSTARDIKKAFFAAASSIQQSPESWDLLSVMNSVVPDNQPEDDIVYLYQPANLPGRFLLYSDPDQAQRQWFSWILDLLRQVLSILRVKFVDAKSEIGIESKTSSEGNIGISVDPASPSLKRSNFVDDCSTMSANVKKARVEEIQTPPSNMTVDSEKSVSFQPKSSKVTSLSKDTRHEPFPSTSTMHDVVSDKTRLASVLTKRLLVIKEHTFSCEMPLTLWSGRKSARRVVDEGPLKDQDILVKEEEVTKILIEQHYKGGLVHSTPVCFSVCAKLCHYRHDVSTKVFVTPKNSCSEFLSFESFFRPYIQKVIKGIIGSS